MNVQKNERMCKKMNKYPAMQKPSGAGGNVALCGGGAAANGANAGNGAAGGTGIVVVTACF